MTEKVTHGWSNQQHGIKVTARVASEERARAPLLHSIYFHFLVSHSASGAFGWAFWSTAVYIGKLFLFIFYSPAVGNTGRVLDGKGIAQMEHPDFGIALCPLGFRSVEFFYCFFFCSGWPEEQLSHFLIP